MANNEGHERDCVSRTLRYANICLSVGKKTQNALSWQLTVGTSRLGVRVMQFSYLTMG
jgi:hypothetical protein